MRIVAGIASQKRAAWSERPQSLAGIFSCALILHCSLGAGRVPPEALVFVSSALTQFSPSGSKQVNPRLTHYRLDDRPSASNTSTHISFLDSSVLTFPHHTETNVYRPSITLYGWPPYYDRIRLHLHLTVQIYTGYVRLLHPTPETVYLTSIWRRLWQRWMMEWTIMRLATVAGDKLVFKSLHQHFIWSGYPAQVLTPSSHRMFAVGILASLFRLALEIVKGLQGNVACSELLSSVQIALTKVMWCDAISWGGLNPLSTQFQLFDSIRYTLKAFLSPNRWNLKPNLHCQSALLSSTLVYRCRLQLP